MKFYVSTYTEGFFNEGPNGSKGIYLLQYNQKNNKLEILNTFSDSVNPSFIKLSKDKKSLFVACEKLPPSRIDNYLVDESYNLKLNDSKKFNGRSCCYININEENNFCVGAHYGSGDVFSYSFNEKLKFKKLISKIKHDNEIGPNVSRQEAPHAHSIRYINGLDQYVACDLGSDRIDFYSYDNSGNLIESDIPYIKTKPGYGPRHTESSKDGKRLYVTCELENRILYYELENNKFVLKQDISSIPKKYKKQNTCADIHISDNGKYLFASNRGNNTIVEFVVNKDGTLVLIDYFNCHGKGPRNFAVFKNCVVCANENSNTVTILELSNGVLTGNLLKTIKIISPVCIEKIKED